MASIYVSGVSLWIHGGLEDRGLVRARRWLAMGRGRLGFAHGYLLGHTSTREVSQIFPVPPPLAFSDASRRSAQPNARRFADRTFVRQSMLITAWISVDVCAERPLSMINSSTA
jgi:hypothetical protein